MPTLVASRRPLTEAERRVIQAKVRASQARSRQASSRAPVISRGIVLVLWLLTLLASDAPWTVVTVFWLVVGALSRGGSGAACGRTRRSSEQWTQGLESALRRDAADVYDVRARAFVELEEFEDEGACYAFELDPGRVVFVSGQEFYEAARFPEPRFLAGLSRSTRPAVRRTC